MISAIGSGHCGRKKLYAGSRGRLAENFALLDKIRILCIAYSLSIFSVGYIKTPWSDVPSLVAFVSVFIVDETSIFCFCPVSKLRLTAGRRKVGEI